MRSHPSSVNAAAVAFGLRKYPFITVRPGTPLTWISPTSPGAASAPSSPMTRTS